MWLAILCIVCSSAFAFFAVCLICGAPMILTQLEVDSPMGGWPLLLSYMTTVVAMLVVASAGFYAAWQRLAG